jgi:hypothetical protein
VQTGLQQVRERRLPGRVGKTLTLRSLPVRLAFVGPASTFAISVPFSIENRQKRRAGPCPSAT